MTREDLVWALVYVRTVEENSAQMAVKRADMVVSQMCEALPRPTIKCASCEKDSGSVVLLDGWHTDWDSYLCPACWRNRGALAEARR